MFEKQTFFEQTLMENFQINSETAQLLKEILPDIQQDLRETITQNIELQYSKALEQQLINKKKKAEQELQESLAQIENQTINIFKQKMMQLDREENQINLQIQHFVREFEKKNRGRIQAENLMENFQKDILQHKHFVTLLEKIKSQVKQKYKQKLTQQLNRRQKEMYVNFKKKETKEKKERHKKIAHQIEVELSQVRKQIQRESIQIAQLRSQHNVTLKKMDKQYLNQKKLIDSKEKEYLKEMNKLTEKINKLKISEHQSKTNDANNQQNYQNSNLRQTFDNYQQKSITKQLSYNISNDIKLQQKSDQQQIMFSEREKILRLDPHSLAKKIYQEMQQASNKKHSKNSHLIKTKLEIHQQRAKKENFKGMYQKELNKLTKQIDSVSFNITSKIIQKANRQKNLFASFKT